MKKLSNDESEKIVYDLFATDNLTSENLWLSLNQEYKSYLLEKNKGFENKPLSESLELLFSELTE